MLKTSKGKEIDISKGKEIAAGGEGRILEHPMVKNRVIKIYHSPRPASFARHLEALSGLDESIFVKPKEIYFNGRGQVCGFDMEYVNFNNYHLFNKLFNKAFCTANHITTSYKSSLLKRVKQAIEDLHALNIIVGDLNQYNIFVSDKGEVKFVDVDSYATSAWPHNGVLLDDIRDWTTLNINKQTDGWAYDILGFWITTYCHPFKWVLPGNTESLEQRVKAGKSYLSSIRGIKIPALYEPPSGEILKQFLEIFSGRRYMVSFDGVHVPVSAVIRQPVASTSLDIRELFTGVKKVNASCGRIAVYTDKWMLVETKIPRVTSLLKTADGDDTFDCDELFPSSSTYAYIKNKTLFGQKNTASLYLNNSVVSSSLVYYNAGSLVVYDTAADKQWNFDISLQMAGISASTTAVFVKSIIVNEVPIQNFGGKKFLNVPDRTRYIMIEVPLGTKTAYYCGGFFAAEYKDKSRVKYVISDYSFNEGRGAHLELDFLPYFAAKDKLLFVPENGKIQVYKDYALLVEMDAPICTRDSRLYTTDSGILLLENGILYLLNTKK
jgi:serine/threonine protein kinase